MDRYRLDIGRFFGLVKSRDEPGGVGSEDERSKTSGDGFETMPGVVKTGGKLKGHRK